MSTSLQIPHITLQVSDLARSLDFYCRQLGFTIATQDSLHAELAPASGTPSILRLMEDRNAVTPPPDAAGLFHAALLFPSRTALGNWLRRAAQQNIEFDGFSDHAVSEAIYFADPDGNGLEFYVDRPRETWPFTGNQVDMVTRRLDVQSLLAAGKAGSGEPLTLCRWGHLHLRVIDLEQSETFYRQTLAMDVMQRTFPGARFLAADGYHHHLGINVWGHSKQTQPAHALGLAQATFSLSRATPAEIHDPNGISLRLEPIST